jgi:hypothetical protein
MGRSGSHPGRSTEARPARLRIEPTHASRTARFPPKTKLFCTVLHIRESTLHCLCPNTPNRLNHGSGDATIVWSRDVAFSGAWNPKEPLLRLVTPQIHASQDLATRHKYAWNEPGVEESQ